MATSRRACERPVNGQPCGYNAIFRVQVGTREHDAEDACRVHLAGAVEALAEGAIRQITVTPLAQGLR